jgi:hypothetical protein
VNGEELLDDYEDIYQESLDANPLLDTLRRWVAPYSGQVQITGDVTLLEDTSDERQEYTTADGVRVAVQHNSNELWATTIEADDYAAKTPSGLESISVSKGDVIYFRVQSIFDGAYDEVSWSPDIQYLAVAPTLDANNLDVYHYNAADDFTLAAHSGMYVNMPLTGTVRIEGELQKVGITTDDITLQLLKNDVPLVSQSLTWGQTGNISLSQEVEVLGQDRIAVQIKSDSPIDLSQLAWSESSPLNLFYVASPDMDELTDEEGNPLVQLDLFSAVDLYPESNLTQPLTPWTAPETGIYTVEPLFFWLPVAAMQVRRLSS